MLKAISSTANAIGALNYKGTWNASTNSPTLASGAGTKGDCYVVSVAGSTTLDSISNWGVGDWATFNGLAWQRIEGGVNGNFVDLSVTGQTTLSDVSAIKDAGDAYVADVKNTTSSGNVRTYNSSLESNGNSTNSHHFRGVTQDVNAWFLYGNGTQSFTSDQKLKKDIETARSGYLQDVANLRIVKYRWKNGPENPSKELGWIAQEVEQVFPGLVQDEQMDNGDSYKVVKSSVFIPILLKCVQELKQEIDALKIKIDFLKTH